MSLARFSIGSGRLEEHLSDRKPLMSAHEAIVEANRCLYCADAPCIPSCPTGIDIPEFIRRISTENLAGSAQTIFEANILGYSCARVCPVEVLCESTCVYQKLGEKPIKIGRLQRYATERALAAGTRFFEAGPPTGKRVALLGAGPASLACAHELRRLGHACVIYEGRDLPGGLNTTGVAPYKLQAEDALREVEWVLGIGGIELRTGVWIGRDVTLEDLEREYDAIFVGVGLGADSFLALPGEDLEGVWGAVDWIERLKNDPDYRLPDHVSQVAVVGGGNTAIDVVRELRGLGIDEVFLVYRRNEPTMAGYAHEWHDARVEGGSARWQSVPVQLLGGPDGRVQAIRCVRTRLIQAEGLRPRVEVQAGSEHDVPCQMVVMAIGQSMLGALFASVDGFAADRGRVLADPLTGRVGQTRYFAGGDCANGGKEVVNASAEGKRAAHGIHALLAAAASPNHDGEA
jgi:dihydropyrimidine dehydrogenase (NAD+) subunit PreT